jgi:ankyrin repeat protein
MSPSQKQYDKTLDHALIRAVEDDEVYVIKALLDCSNANPNAQDQYGRTALMVAALRNSKGIIQTLLDHGANHDAQRINGWTALIFAVRWSTKKIIKTLLDHGANPNIQNQTGDTVLMLAVSWNRTEIIQTLLSYGADPTIKNNQNQTARMLAEERGNLDAFDHAVNNVINEHNYNVSKRLLAARDDWASCPLEILEYCIKQLLAATTEDDLSELELEHARTESSNAEQQSKKRRLLR